MIYADHFAHVALATVVKIYIRLIGLFPGAVDLKSCARDLTRLADALDKCTLFLSITSRRWKRLIDRLADPGIHFSAQLKNAVKRAKNNRLFPEDTPLASSSHDVLDDRSNNNALGYSMTDDDSEHSPPLPSLVSAFDTSTTTTGPVDMLGGFWTRQETSMDDPFSGLLASADSIEPSAWDINLLFGDQANFSIEEPSRNGKNGV